MADILIDSKDDHEEIPQDNPIPEISQSNAKTTFFNEIALFYNGVGWWRFCQFQIFLCFVLIIYIIYDIEKHWDNNIVIILEQVILSLIILDLSLRLCYIGCIIWKDKWFQLDLVILILFMICFLYMTFRTFTTFGEEVDQSILGLRLFLQVVRFIFVIYNARDNLKKQNLDTIIIYQNGKNDDAGSRDLRFSDVVSKTLHDDGDEEERIGLTGGDVLRPDFKPMQEENDRDKFMGGSGQPRHVSSHKGLRLKSVLM